MAKLMPFGKHRGKPIAKLPPSYVRWLLANCDLSDNLRTQLMAVFNGETNHAADQTTA